MGGGGRERDGIKMSYVYCTSDCLLVTFYVLQMSGMGGNKQEDAGSKTFRLERCQVSTVAKGLVALIRSTLLEACSEQVSRIGR